MKLKEAKKIERWAKDLDGVFTISDLKILNRMQSEIALFKKLNAMILENVLIKVKRGIYAVPGTALDIISHRINPAAYISTGTVLSKNAIIGSMPKKKITAVKIGVPRKYECELGIIEHLSINSKLFFGFNNQNGIHVATPEKALIDTYYYFYRGRKFSFDLDGDINRDALNSALISQYLQSYDKRFVTFFRRIWDND